MAFGIKVGTAFLDMLDSAELTFEINNELWVTGDPTVNLGSYTFPFTIPLTDQNRYLLRFPDRIEAFTTLSVIEDVVIYIGEGRSIGLPFIVGNLYIKTATRLTADIFIISKGLNNVDGKKFADVDMGITRIGGPVSPESLMNGTITYPLLNDFVFFPVLNKTLYDIYRGTGILADYFAAGQYGAATQNHYSPGRGWSVFNTAAWSEQKRFNLPITPFLRLEYVLDRVAELMGYTMVNQWQLNDELKSICIYSNKSISDLDSGFKEYIIYNEHLPADMILTDFLKEVAKYAFCGIFVDQVAKTITLMPYKYLLMNATRHNWTAHQLRDYEVEQDNELPEAIGFDRDGADQYFDNNFVTTETLIEDGAYIADYYKRGGNPNLHGLIDGYYHVKRDNTVMRYDPSKNWLAERWSKFSHKFKEFFVGGKGDKWLSKVIPMWSDSYEYSFGANPFTYSLPRADVQLNIQLHLEDDDKPEILTGKLSNIRLMMYRGMRYTVNPDSSMTSDDYPYANATAYDPATQLEDFQHSLHYDGVGGMVETFGAEWIAFMQTKKTVRRPLKLPLQDILNFREMDKVRIGNMDYFIKSLKISVNQHGINPTECVLVSIPFSVNVPE